MSIDPPRRNFSWFDRLLDMVSWTCKLLAGVALVSLTFMFGWLVWGRYVLNATPTWVEQVSLLLMVVITFLGAAVGIHENTHLGVSYFRELCPEPVRRAFLAVSHLSLAGFGLVLMVTGYQLTLFKWGSQIPLIHLPEGLRALPSCIGGGLICLFSVGHLSKMARGIEQDSLLVE
ncbi:MAG TPA: TRAP transporter small permease [Amaricoccus sp.]|uniref:TRAP transporter small permease n=1 Tax=Amaricoccus sp. TaxID=1872485 RepID=UPI001DBB62BB|nr:TRAP transporter small permease [Amaricoccus sp.]MCB1370443.1 TRAP transporter small permease [Paracoccaceae bacterium]MCC0067401.1 TRAP transporter small permease [Rhodovulum sp.]HPG22237.1 TRAP transporter small permease [Amaricoccus sp.]HRW14058.1 TRAP transporter small permease [Amaricoccus sp.]